METTKRQPEIMTFTDEGIVMDFKEARKSENPMQQCIDDFKAQSQLRPDGVFIPTGSPEDMQTFLAKAVQLAMLVNAGAECGLELTVVKKKKKKAEEASGAHGD